MYTAYHAKYYAHELTRRHGADGVDRLSQSLFDARVDLNPHQIEAALFALRNPLQEGVLLADEVGLGKTIEAALVLCQYWAERQRRLLIICPAALRKQWAQELQDKFAVPALVVDSATLKQQGQTRMLSALQSWAGQQVLILSYPFAARHEAALRAIAWDVVVMDEAHKLRNAHRSSNRTGQALKRALAGRKKLLLTATPLQNSLMELYGLSTLLDEHLFGEEASFRRQFMSGEDAIPALRRRLRHVVKRTLRKDVLEYIRYTERKALTQPFEPTDEEHALHERISAFLQREHSYALPRQQRHLTSLILRKLLASSPQAVVATLRIIRERLQAMLAAGVMSDPKADEDMLARLMAQEDMDEALLARPSEEEDQPEVEGEAEAEGEHTTLAVERVNALAHVADGKPSAPFANRASLLPQADRQGEAVQLRAVSIAVADWDDEKIDPELLRLEIAELGEFIDKAENLPTDTKAAALLKALKLGFDNMAALGAPRKAIIFTESRRTQEYLARFLSAHGYEGKLAIFSGTNTDPESTAIYKAWLKTHAGTDRVTGSAQVDRRTALIDHFRQDDGRGADIMIATEAAAEGVNLQFCSLLINYDLPWNPQRVEQRIGRCHRYGQRFDVVVINFLNTRNQADQRVLELLTDKFNLFSGVFGASDEILGQLEGGIDFEKRVLQIYDTCRQPAEIESAFNTLQQELEAVITNRIRETQAQLLENFDEDVHERLKLKLDEAQARLDRLGRWFWGATRYALQDRACFDEAAHAFSLSDPPPAIAAGRYQLLRGGAQPDRLAHAYRLSHPLGEWCLAQGLASDTPTAELVFAYSRHAHRLSVIERLKGQAGWLILSRVQVSGLDSADLLLFSARTDQGEPLDQDICEKLLSVQASGKARPLTEPVPVELMADHRQAVAASIAEVLERHQRLFEDERDKLEQWAEDKLLAAEEAMRTTRARINQLKRDARKATTVSEQADIQRALAEQERKRKRQREALYDVEDEIAERRDAMIEALQARLTQTTQTDTLFTLRWRVE
ncbi:MAG: SNF2-related protein [Lautropia sp.]|nr:SNF2-related protein [Lautropia sp.]